MEWLEHDCVSVSRLPKWAQEAEPALDGRPYRLAIEPAGLVLLRGRRASALPWEEVLVVVTLSDPERVLIAAPRRPPRPPWFEVEGPDVEVITERVRARVVGARLPGYRRAPRTTRMDVDDVLAAVLARRPIPGAVEIPAASEAGGWVSTVGISVATSAAYGSLLGVRGLLVGMSIGVLASAAVLAVRWKPAWRVLVLTPDAYIAGLDGGQVRAVPWARVGAFRVGSREGGPSLEVVGRHGELVATVPARRFGAPLEVIAKVAEAYRERAHQGTG